MERADGYSLCYIKYANVNLSVILCETALSLVFTCLNCVTRMVGSGYLKPSLIIDLSTIHNREAETDDLLD